MKKIILIFAFSFFCNIIYAQLNDGNKIPSWVETTLSKQFQNISIDDWQKIDTKYFVQFKYNNHQTEVCVGPNHNIVYSQTLLNKNELPSLIIDVFNDDYPSEIIQKIKLNADYKGDKTYIIKTMSDKGLIFDSTGQLIE
jgi:hypothetical protein